MKGDCLFRALNQFGHVAMLAALAWGREFDSSDWLKTRVRARHPALSRHDALHSMDLERDGNLIEAGVWFLLSLVLLVQAFCQNKRLRGTLLVLCFTLAAFGGSDLVEARTGAWWKPWWLFVWKAQCVVILFFGFMRYYRIKKSLSAPLVSETEQGSMTP